GLGRARGQGDVIRDMVSLTTAADQEPPMANLTDYHYAITGVRFDPDRKHIDQLEERLVNKYPVQGGAQQLGPVHPLPRALVISNILSPSNPKSYVTAT